MADAFLSKIHALFFCLRGIIWNHLTPPSPPKGGERGERDTSSGFATWTRSRPLARPIGPPASPYSFRSFPNCSSLPPDAEKGLEEIGAAR